MPTSTFPDDILPATAMFGLQSNTESFTSPLNRSTQTVERPGSRWKARLTFSTMSLTQQRRLKAYLTALNGMAGRTYLWPHDNPGSALYSPVVNGTMTDFKSLPTKSWPASTLVLRAGDYLEVNGELKMVLADVTSDASGLAAVPVGPPFRKAPANLAAINLDKPKALMLLASDVWEFVTTPAWRHESFSIDFIEVFQ